MQGVNVTTETIANPNLELVEEYGPASSAMVHVIEPPRGLLGINWREIWNYRELLYFMMWRDIKVRYKQTVLGAAWAVLQPLVTMIIFTFFFGKLERMQTVGGTRSYY